MRIRKKLKNTIRVNIFYRNEPPQSVVIENTTMKEVSDVIIKSLSNITAPALSKYKTRIVVRQHDGSKYLKCKSISFFGLTPLQTKELIEKNIKKMHHEKIN